MKNLVLGLIVLFSVLQSGLAPALDIEGVKIDDKVSLAGLGDELVLNGAGVRHKLAFLKVYIGSLYLKQKKTDADQILADLGPKRVSLYILANEVTAPDFISSLNNALAANLSPHELALIEKRVSDLNKMLAQVKAIGRGSIVLVDYLPAKGTRITINGQEKITIPGEDFFRALLHIWIGRKPVDGRLRDAMLGAPHKLF